MKTLILLAAAMLAVASPALCQQSEPAAAKPSSVASGPYGYDKNATRPDARQIRAEREKCVARVPSSRKLVEEHAGAVAALNNCSAADASRFCEAYDAGKFDGMKLDELLAALASVKGGAGDAALWVIDEGHAKQLEDADAMGAFAADPLTAALNIRPLSAMAAEFRAARLTTQEEDQKLLDRIAQVRAGTPQAAQPPADWQPAALSSAAARRSSPSFTP